MYFPPSHPAESAAVTVSELNRRAKQLLEKNIPLMWIAGEISNFTRAPSGHWYFSLKDAHAQVRCAMFRHKSQYLDWIPQEGMQVEVRAQVTLYEPRGDFQLAVEGMRRAGLGALYEAFEKLKGRLELEGLFNEQRKRPLPTFPRQIGIVTSPAAAALRDVLTTLRRRMPSIPVVLYPTPVQGEGAAAKIAVAIHAASQRAECDVLILCRGGGSIEDLWAFNEEAVARAIAASKVPVVCGVGHETDFTIADFVADRRAPTPTAAAEMASPNRADLLHRVGIVNSRLARLIHRGMENRMQQLDYLARRLLHPGERIQTRLDHLGHLGQRLQRAATHALSGCNWGLLRLNQRLLSAAPDIPARLAQQQTLAQRLRLAAAHQLQSRQNSVQRLELNLAHLNPQAVFARGFSMVQKADGRIVRDSRELMQDELIDITFADGRAKAQVKEKTEK